MHWKDNVWNIGRLKKRSTILLDESEDWGGEFPEQPVYKRKKIKQTRIEDFLGY